MRKVETKTGGEKATVVNGLVVKMQHTTYHKASDSHFAMTTSFDFADVSEEDIRKMAAEMLLIRWRTAFKNSEKVDEKADGETVKVAEMLKKSRSKLTLAEKVKRLGVSKEELLALLGEENQE